MLFTSQYERKMSGTEPSVSDLELLQKINLAYGSIQLKLPSAVAGALAGGPFADKADEIVRVIAEGEFKSVKESDLEGLDLTVLRYDSDGMKLNDTEYAQRLAFEVLMNKIRIVAKIEIDNEDIQQLIDIAQSQMEEQLKMAKVAYVQQSTSKHDHFNDGVLRKINGFSVGVLFKLRRGSVLAAAKGAATKATSVVSSSAQDTLKSKAEEEQLLNLIFLSLNITEDMIVKDGGMKGTGWLGRSFIQGSNTIFDGWPVVAFRAMLEAVKLDTDLQHNLSALISASGGQGKLDATQLEDIQDQIKNILFRNQNSFINQVAIWKAHNPTSDLTDKQIGVLMGNAVRDNLAFKVRAPQSMKARTVPLDLRATQAAEAAAAKAAEAAKAKAKTPPPPPPPPRQPPPPPKRPGAGHGSTKV